MTKVMLTVFKGRSSVHLTYDVAHVSAANHAAMLFYKSTGYAGHVHRRQTGLTQDADSPWTSRRQTFAKTRRVGQRMNMTTPSCLDVYRSSSTNRSTCLGLFT